MLNQPIKLILAVSCVFVTGVAQAGWNGIEWGSTTTQVKKQLSHSARELTASEEKRFNQPGVENRTLFAAPYEAGKLQFTGFFKFTPKGHHFVAVGLELNDPKQKYALLKALQDKYGAPDRSGAMGDISYMWLKGADKIHYTELPELGPNGEDIVKLFYWRRKTSESEGL